MPPLKSPSTRLASILRNQERSLSHSTSGRTRPEGPDRTSASSYRHTDEMGLSAIAEERSSTISAVEGHVTDNTAERSLKNEGAVSTAKYERSSQSLDEEDEKDRRQSPEQSSTLDEDFGKAEPTFQVSPTTAVHLARDMHPNQAGSQDADTPAPHHQFSLSSLICGLFKTCQSLFSLLQALTTTRHSRQTQ